MPLRFSKEEKKREKISHSDGFRTAGGCFKIVRLEESGHFFHCLDRKGRLLLCIVERVCSVQVSIYSVCF